MYMKRYNRIGITGFVDSDYAGDHDSGKSITRNQFQEGDDCLVGSHNSNDIFLFHHKSRVYGSRRAIVVKGSD